MAESSSTLDLSIIVLTWNSSRHIGKCIEEVIKDISQASLESEIFIVDNGSSDDTVSIVTALASQYGELLKPIYLKSNTGTTVPRNMALRRAKGRYIAIIDSDAYPVEGSFQRLIDRVEENRRIGMVAPKLVYPDGRYQKSTDRFPTLFSKAYRFFFLRSMELREAVPEDGPVDYAISAFWMMKQEIVSSVGLLDEKIFYSPEDVDYCLRIWRAGYEVHFCPSALAVHDAQEISRGFRITTMKLNHLYGLLYFFRKYGYCLKAPNCSVLFQNPV